MPEFFDPNPNNIERRFEVTIFDAKKVVPPPIPSWNKQFRGVIKDHQKGISFQVEADTIDELQKLLSEKRREES